MILGIQIEIGNRERGFDRIFEFNSIHFVHKSVGGIFSYIILVTL